jgi:hypothetical protein
MGVSGQRHAPAALYPGKGPPVPIVQEAGWAPESVWTQRLEEKPFVSAGHRTPVVQSILRHWLQTQDTRSVERNGKLATRVKHKGEQRPFTWNKNIHEAFDLLRCNAGTSGILQYTNLVRREVSQLSAQACVLGLLPSWGNRFSAISAEVFTLNNNRGRQYAAFSYIAREGGGEHSNFVSDPVVGYLTLHALKTYGQHGALHEVWSERFGVTAKWQSHNTYRVPLQNCNTVSCVK